LTKALYSVLPVINAKPATLSTLEQATQFFAASGIVTKHALPDKSAKSYLQNSNVNSRNLFIYFT
jgi:hypothetical protein